MNQAKAIRAALLAVLCSASAAVFAGPGDYLASRDGRWDQSGSFENVTDHAIGDIPAGGKGPWQQNAVFRGDGTNLGDGGSKKLTNDIYQIDWRTSQRTISAPVGSVLRLGAGGIVSHTWGNGPIWLNNSSTSGEVKFLLVADQSWHNNGEANASCSLKTEKYNGKNVFKLVAESGVTLTLRESFGIDNYTDTTFAGNIIVQDSSWIRLAEGVSFKAGKVTLVGGKAKVTFAGDFSELTDEFVLDNGANFTANGHRWDLVKPFAVTSGTSTLAGKLIVSGVGQPLQVEVAEGATLVVTALIVDESGEPVEILNSGTGSVVMKAVNVGNTPLTETEVDIGEGESLNVFGDGLTAATAINLSGGRLKVWSDGVTIASPITVTTATAGLSSSIEVETGCEAVFTGAITHENSAATALRFIGDGTKVFTGSASFLNCCSFRHEAGDVVVSNATWTVVGTSGDKRANCSVRDQAQLFYWGANSKLEFSYAYFDVCAAEKNVDGGILEFGKGSEFYIPNSAALRVMTETVSRGTLRVSGGYLHDQYLQGFIEVGNHSYGSLARLEFLSGVIQCTTPIVSRSAPYNADYAHAVFLWKGGTLRATKSTNFSTYGKRFFSGTGAGSMEVIVDGPDCIWDVGHPYMDEIALWKENEKDASSTASGIRWSCTENGLVTLTNSTTRAGRLVVHNPFTNMNIRVCANAGLRADDSESKAYPFSLARLEKGGADAFDGIVLHDGLPRAATTIGGVAGVPLSKTDLDGWTYENLGFEPGAIYAFRSKGGIAETLTVPGRIVLPEQMYFAAETDRSLAEGGSAVLTAVGGIEGEGTLEPFPGSRKLIYSVKDDSVVFEQRGMIMLLR